MSLDMNKTIEVLDASIVKLKSLLTNKTFRFVINGEIKEWNAKNQLQLMSDIVKAYPEVEKLDYRKLNIIEL